MIAPESPRSGAEDGTDALLAELVERYIDRLHRGEPVDARAFAAEHPAHAESLLALIPAAATMAELRRAALRDAAPLAHLRLESPVVGGYRIVREIGRGGMGVVYEAEQVAQGRRVALKVLPASSAMDPRQIERFRVEGQAAAAMDHPHIVPVFEIGCEDRLHFLAMQLVEGRSLAALIHEAGSGGVAPGLGHLEAARLAWQAAEALGYAHGLGILHRDVKPANLLLDSTGHLWVADFGLARFLGRGDLTQTGDVIGTLRYLSPEQARGCRTIGPRADVYGLGATLYELATLRPAFHGQDRQELLRQIAGSEPVAPRRLDPAIPRDLETIIITAMAKEAADRYDSARDLAADLRRFLEGRPILAQRPGPPERAARWARRNRAAMSAASAILALFLAGTALAAVLLWREQVRTGENLRLALTALDDFCLAEDGLMLTRDPERARAVQDLQLKALAIYERMLRQNPNDLGTRWAAARADHRVARSLAGSPRSAEAGPIFRVAHDHLAVLLLADPARLEYRREAADVVGDWGASGTPGKPEPRALRLRALGEHLKLASEFPSEPSYRRAASRDCIELARCIGVADPTDVGQKEGLFRQALALRQGLDDRTFEGKAELAEAHAYLGHLLNATRRGREGGEVMARGRAILAAGQAQGSGDLILRHRAVVLENLFLMPRYCDPSPDPDEVLRAHEAAIAAKARLAAEFPFIPEFRAELAWGHHLLSSTQMQLGRAADAEAGARRSMDLFEDLIRDHPTVQHYRQWAAQAAESLGTLLWTPERIHQARALFLRAAELSPERSRARARIARTLADLRPGSTAPSGPSPR